jgi:hypothetical protein
MVSFNSILVISVLALAGQSMAGQSIVKVGASVIGGLIGSGSSSSRRELQAAVAAAGPKSDATSGSTNGTAALDPATLKAVEPLFKDCFAALKANPGELHLNKLTKGAQMTGIPPQCITSANKLLALPNIKEIEKFQGTVTVVNSNTLAFSGIDKLVDELLKADGATPLKKGPTSPKKSPTSATPLSTTSVPRLSPSNDPSAPVPA